MFSLMFMMVRQPSTNPLRPSTPGNLDRVVMLIKYLFQLVTFKWFSERLTFWAGQVKIYLLSIVTWHLVWLTRSQLLYPMWCEFSIIAQSCPVCSQPYFYLKPFAQAIKITNHSNYNIILRQHVIPKANLVRMLIMAR